MKWATKGNEIKASEKNRKKVNTHLRRNGSKKKIKSNRFGQMEDKRKTKSQLIRELVELRQQVGELEASKVGNLICTTYVKNQKQKGSDYDICY